MIEAIEALKQLEILANGLDNGLWRVIGFLEVVAQNGKKILIAAPMRRPRTLKI